MVGLRHERALRIAAAFMIPVRKNTSSKHSTIEGMHRLGAVAMLLLFFFGTSLARSAHLASEPHVLCAVHGTWEHRVPGARPDVSSSGGKTASRAHVLAFVSARSAGGASLHEVAGPG